MFYKNKLIWKPFPNVHAKKIITISDVTPDSSFSHDDPLGFLAVTHKKGIWPKLTQFVIQFIEC